MRTRRSSSRSARPATGCERRRDGSMRPRLRSGWALKRVADDPGDVRYVLRDLRSKAFMRLDEPDAQLLSLLDGRRTIGELLGEATTLLGAGGPGRLARLIADCGDRGMLDGIAATPGDGGGAERCCARVLEPRERTFESDRTGSSAPTRLGPAVVLPAGRDRADPPVARRARHVLLPDRRAVRHAAGRRAPSAARRSGVHRRTLPARRAPRVRARRGARALRAADRPRRAAAGDDLPVRVRRHERGVLRAAGRIGS